MKRGHEWHAPDFMPINIRHVEGIEPVGPDSRVASAHPGGLIAGGAGARESQAAGGRAG